MEIIQRRRPHFLPLLLCLIILVLPILIECRRGGGGGSGGKTGSSAGKSGKTALFAVAGGGAAYAAFKTEKSTYYKREGIGMSAWGLLAIILGIIGFGTACWFCYSIGLPIMRDRRRSQRSSTEGNIPLQETPSTASPSP